MFKIFIKDETFKIIKKKSNRFSEAEIVHYPLKVESDGTRIGELARLAQVRRFSLASTTRRAITDRTARGFGDSRAKITDSRSV